MIIDGKAIAGEVEQELKQELKRLGASPRLDVILVGEDSASQVYVRMKGKACERIGIASVKHELPASTSQEELLSLIDKLNKDPEVTGLIVQLPVPGHISSEAVLQAIDPSKDVDGFHPMNMGNLLSGNDSLVPSTPQGIMELLRRSKIGVAGKDAVVVGRSNIVGKPVAILLMRENATVTICHSRTKDLASKTSGADILVVAIGKPNFITADMVKDGATVIDVGMNKVDGKLTGDVDFDAVKEKAANITPVPKGVGPMTIAMLMHNTLLAYKLQKGIK